MSRVEWLQARQDGIGGSDISSILGLNHRFSAVELFYQKIGFSKSSTEENEAMFWGSRNEDKVLEIAQYYDFESGQYVDNFNTGKKLRKITKLRYMVNNPEYPWIIANIDGATNFTPKTFKMDGPAEAKTISRQTAEMWTDKIPPYHIIQINTYAIVCAPMMRTNSASIFYLEDGNKFRGYHIPVIESIKDQILTRSEKFWKTVLMGREILANTPDRDNALRYLAQYEPNPDNTEAYYDYMSELFKLKQSFTQIDGSEMDLVNAKEYNTLGKKIKSLEENRQEYKNLIMKSLHNAGANVMILPNKQGKITYNKKLYVNINDRA